MTASDNNKFVCPECKGALNCAAGDYECVECGNIWKTVNDIPVFFKKDAPYWSEIPQDEADELNKTAREIGWEAAIKSFFPDHLYQFVLDKNRIGWKYFIKSDTAGTVLDVGSGWGTLSFLLTKDCKSVYALESVWQRVEFTKIRSEQDRLENLTPVCGSVLNMPFADNTFDVVILNGVLEWLGLSDLTKRPDEVQKNALREIFRVLKPGGSLYVGIEQALALFYFVGVKDPHSGLRYATLMPRVVSNVYSKIVKKRPYSTYIYSMCGYRKILKTAGFNDISFYVPVPGYLNFKYIVPLNSPKVFKYWFSNLILPRLLFSPGMFRAVYSLMEYLLAIPLIKRIFKYFVPDFSIIAVKDK